MFCEPCKSAMVTRLSHSLARLHSRVREGKKPLVTPMYKVTSTCVECGAMEDVGHIV